MRRVKVRMSALNTWMTCEGQAMSYLDDMEIEREGGPAAHTGTAIGRAIELFHIAKISGGETPSLEAILDQVEEESEGCKRGDREVRPFHKAKWPEVSALFYEYCKDERHSEITVIPEVPVSFEIERPEGIVSFKGTMDQVRISNSRASVWDMKNGAKTGYEMTGAYWAQLYAYTYGLIEATNSLELPGMPSHIMSELLEANVGLGGVMRLQEYIKPLPRAGQKVFYPIVTTVPTIRRALERIADRILEVTGSFSPALLKPGNHCSWCPHESHNLCVHIA